MLPCCMPGGNSSAGPIGASAKPPSKSATSKTACGRASPWSTTQQRRPLCGSTYATQQYTFKQWQALLLVDRVRSLQSPLSALSPTLLYKGRLPKPASRQPRVCNNRQLALNQQVTGCCITHLARTSPGRRLVAALRPSSHHQDLAAQQTVAPLMPHAAQTRRHAAGPLEAAAMAQTRRRRASAAAAPGDRSTWAVPAGC